MRRGFTMVEILITLVVIAVLLTLSVVSLRSVQASARDNEREQDAQTIARGIEQYYTFGNPRVTGYVTRSTYPGTYEFMHILGQDRCAGPEAATSYPSPACSVPGGYINQVFPGVNIAAMTPSGKSSPDLISADGLTDAQIDTQTKLNRYIYKPMSGTSATQCLTGGCSRFELYYWDEVGQSAKKISSKNQ